MLFCCADETGAYIYCGMFRNIDAEAVDVRFSLYDPRWVFWAFGMEFSSTIGKC